MKAEAQRFNADKIRMDLIPPELTIGVGRVLTFGAKKYAPHNWKKGLKYSNILASLKRHLTALEAGEDFDEESGEPHSAHIATNISFLMWNEKHRPDMDDRPHHFRQPLRVGLDVDDVLADFIGAYSARYGEQTPEFWNFDPQIKARLKELESDKPFWLGLKRKIEPHQLQFEPHCYITSRGIPTEWTKEWLYANGFPHREVYTVGLESSKVEAAKASGIDVFVDNRYDNFLELNRAGITTYLLDSPHNRRYKVGARRIQLESLCL